MYDENKAWHVRSKLTVKRSEARLDISQHLQKLWKWKKAQRSESIWIHLLKLTYLQLIIDVIKKYFWKLKNVQQSKIWSYFNRDALRSGVTALIAVVKTLFVPPPQFRSTTWIVCVFCSYSLFLWKNLGCQCLKTECNTLKSCTSCSSKEVIKTFFCK